MLVRLGMHAALPMGISLGDCTNFSIALDVARNQVRTGSMRHIIVATSDRVTAESTRLLDLGMSVFSDGVASCLVSGTPGPFQLLDMAHHSIPRVDVWDLESQLENFYADTARGILMAVDRLLSAHQSTQKKSDRDY